MNAMVEVHRSGFVPELRKFSRVPCIGEKVAMDRRLYDVAYVCHDIEIPERAATIVLEIANGCSSR